MTYNWRSLAISALILCVDVLPSSANVLYTDQHQFEAVVKGGDLVLGSFCVPWYEPCKALSPELDAVAETLAAKKSISVVSIDCSVESKLCHSYGISSYPTIRVFQNIHKNSRYRGKQQAKDIIVHVVKQTLPTVSKIDNSNIDELVILGVPVLIAYTDPGDATSTEKFSSAAKSLLQEDIIFGTSSDLTLLSKVESMTHLPFIVLYNPFDEVKMTFQKPFDVVGITQFARAASKPLIGKFGPENFARYLQGGVPLALIFAESEVERSALSLGVKHLAIHHQGTINFATVDAKLFGFLASHFSLEPGRFPAFVIHDTLVDEAFPFDQNKDLTPVDIEKFVEGFVLEHTLQNILQ